MSASKKTASKTPDSDDEHTTIGVEGVGSDSAEHDCKMSLALVESGWRLPLAVALLAVIDDQMTMTQEEFARRRDGISRRFRRNCKILLSH